ncbi:hypothetical protein, partial [Escherichia coli]|uniref:hypothetical protein n=1 Tax=Escherichia coli TaxID=562 RepID=UPI001BDB9EAD
VSRTSWFVVDCRLVVLMLLYPLLVVFFFNVSATHRIYTNPYPPSLTDALPVGLAVLAALKETARIR